MPLVLLDESNLNYKFAVWKRNESISYFLESMVLSPDETAQIYGLSGFRVLEWLSSRYLLNLIIGENRKNVFLKDQYGKPYIPDYEKFISLSHSNNMVAVAVSDFPVGIDIERVNRKAFTVKEKFISDSDMLQYEGDDEIHFYTKLWTVKEAVYKAYGEKGLKFKEQIRLQSKKECTVVLCENESKEYWFDSYDLDEHILSISWLKTNK
jgi:4'-phosphopantetheinyl transferase